MGPWDEAKYSRYSVCSLPLNVPTVMTVIHICHVHGPGVHNGVSLISELLTSGTGLGRCVLACIHFCNSCRTNNLEHVHFKQDIDSISITIITCTEDEIHNVHCMLEGNVM